MPIQVFYKQLLFLLLLMIIFGVWSIYLGQDLNWDLQNYHFYDPYAFLHHRLDFDIAPAMMQTYFNPFLDILNYFLIITQKPIVVGFLLGAISGITAFFTYKITLLLLEKPWPAIFSVIIGMTGYASVVQLGATTNETKTACLLTIAVYCILKSLSPFNKENKRSLYWLIFSGFLTGLAIGFKLTAAINGMGIIIGYLFMQRPTKIHVILTLTLITATAIGFLVSNGYWMWVLYQHFQNPFFPFYNNIFHSPYASLVNFKDTHFYPHDWKHYVFLPFYFLTRNTLASELTMRDPRLAVTFIFILLFAFYKLFTIIKKKNIPLPSSLQFLLVTFIISYLSWLFQFSIYRYTIMLEILSGILITYFISYFFKNSFLQVSTLVVLAAGIQSGTLYTQWSRVPFTNAYFISRTIMPLPPHALLLLLGGAPLGYMIPFIAPHNRVFGISNNFIYPTYKNKLQEEENQLILHFKGHLYSLASPNRNTLDNSKVLNYYHLRQNTSQCVTITTFSLENKNLLLCPLLLAH